MKLKIKKGDTVEVIAGADKGKKGKVLELNSGKLKIKVEGIRVQTNFDKKDGIKKLEGFLDYSNVRLAEAAATATKGTAGSKSKKTVKTTTVNVKDAGEDVAATSTKKAPAKPRKKAVAEKAAAAKV